MQLPVEVEFENVPQHRSATDRSLTIKPEVHTVNPQDPSHTYTVPPDEYTRFRNSLMYNPSSLFGREEVLGKRFRTKEMGVVMTYNDSVHLSGIAANEATHDTIQHDLLRSYEHVVQLHDLKNEPVESKEIPPNYTTGQLIAQSNKTHQTYEEKENNPGGKFKSFPRS